MNRSSEVIVHDKGAEKSECGLELADIDVYSLPCEVPLLET
jgi:hypothetical protein